MKQNKMKSALSAVAACSLFGIVGTAIIAPMTQLANAEVSPPVGYVKLTFKGESDTPFSLPMNRPRAATGQVSSISGNVINIGNTNLTIDQFKYVDGDPETPGTQTEKYYLLFTTGLLEGRSFDIDVNGTGTITVLEDGDGDLESLLTPEVTDPITPFPEDNFEIRPHWTLNTLFPDGEGFPSVSSTFATPTALIQAKPNDAVGNNHPVNKSYFYVTGTNAGWYDTATPIPGSTVNNTILSRNRFYLCRNTTTDPIVKNLLGDVPVTDERITINVLSDFISQDTHIAFPYPIGITLDQTGLQDTAFFTKSTSGFAADGDLLQAYDATATGYDNPTTKSYYYVPDFGWYLSSDPVNVVPGTTVLDTAGKGFIIRTTSDKEEESKKHQLVRPYDPFKVDPPQN